MFYFFYQNFGDTHIIFNVFRYLTFRAAAAFITAYAFAYFTGPLVIRIFNKLSVVESVGIYMTENHKQKQGTPTMGGLIILTGLFLASVLWNNLSNRFIQILLFTGVWLGLLGFIDDYLKNIKKVSEGLVAKYKILGQLTLALLFIWAIYLIYPNSNEFTIIAIPFLKNIYLNIGLFFPLLVIFMIIGTSNAVNLADGLDGLAGGTTIFASFALAIMSYIKGNQIIAGYLNMDFIAEAGELTVFIFALIGTTLGFLWYNIKPAQIFMGDTGSLSLGGLLAVISILLKEQIFFAIVGGVFVIEALSSMGQTLYFKYTKKFQGKGRRLLLCAPLHHHFERKKIPEGKIVIRFWIIAALFAAIGLITIKLR